MRKMLIIAVAAALAVTAASCGDDDTSGSSTTTAGGATTTAASGATTTGGGGKDPASVKVGMVLPGPKNDGGFNEAHYRGLELAAKELGVQISVQENVVDDQARIDALRNMANDNDLVIGVGGQFAEPGVTIAGQFPDKQIAIINGQASDSTNLHVYGVRQGVPAYIAGVVAAELTKANKVGYLGGELIPPTTQSDSGFQAGAKSGNPDIEYASTIVGTFNDPAKAKDAAAAQIASGTDVLFALIDAGFAGVMQAVDESGKDVQVFDAIFPRCDSSEKIIGTAILNSDALVKQIVQDYLDDSMPAEPQFFGVEDENIQRLELCPKFDTPELSKIVEDTTKGINDGSIKLPADV